MSAKTLNSKQNVIANSNSRAPKCPVGSKLQCLWRDDKYRLAEVLDTREINGKFQYYVHFEEFNKRLDEWVTEDRLDFSSIQLTDVQKKVPSKSKGKDTASKSKIGKKRKYDDMSVDIHFPTEKEHEEITKVKNIQFIEFGKYEIETWYFSPYPEEFHSCTKLYICEFCLKYMKKKKTLIKHKLKCDLRHPPGREIYKHDNLSMFEVDGKDDKIYCQNLCLISKLFLDHKTLYYDVEPFLFYILTENDEQGCHIVGYFSKEKNSPDNFNLACILTLPPHQRKGYGKFLISFSYEISKKENKVGTPERPLSDLGELSYKSYWTEVILEILNEKRNLTIKELSTLTAIATQDIIKTLQPLGLIKYWKGQHILSYNSKTVEDNLKRSKDRKINPKAIHWSPKTT